MRHRTALDGTALARPRSASPSIDTAATSPMSASAERASFSSFAPVSAQDATHGKGAAVSKSDSRQTDRSFSRRAIGRLIGYPYRRTTLFGCHQPGFPIHPCLLPSERACKGGDSSDLFSPDRAALLPGSGFPAGRRARVPRVDRTAQNRTEVRRVEPSATRARAIPAPSGPGEDASLDGCARAVLGRGACGRAGGGGRLARRATHRRRGTQHLAPPQGERFLLQKRCANDNHGRAIVTVRFCPSCGSVVNGSIHVHSCAPETHARMRRSRSSYCVGCGLRLLQDR